MTQSEVENSFSNERPTPDHLLLIAITVEGGFALFALLVGQLTGIRPFDNLFSSRAHLSPNLVIGIGLVAAIPALLVAWMLDRWPCVSGLVEVRRKMRHEIGPLFQRCALWELFLIALLAGVGEELFFRGFLQKAIGTADLLGNSSVVAILLAAVLFGAAHWLSNTYACLACGMGIYLGWLYYVTDDIAAPILTHAAYDFALLFAYSRPGTADESAASRQV